MAKRLRLGFLIILVLGAAALAGAQSNAMIDSILEEEVASVGSAAYVALSAAGLVDDDSAPSRAVTVATEAGWLPAGSQASDPATFGQIAYLLMEAMEVKGGLVYRIIPGPRYAAREFVYQKWSPERRAPGDRVTGQFLVRIAGTFLESAEVSR